MLTNFMVAALGLFLIALGLAWMFARALGVWPILALFGLRSLSRQARAQEMQTETLRELLQGQGPGLRAAERKKAEKRKFLLYLLVVFLGALYFLSSAHKG
jgi:hypothetical protein